MKDRLVFTIGFTVLTTITIRIEYLRILRDFFGMKFKIVSDIDTDTLTLSCVGIGYTNISKKAQ